MNFMLEAFPDIDIKTRFIVLCLDAKLCTNRLSTMLKIPLRTAQDWEKKIQKGKDIRKVEPGRGIKPVITEDIKKKVVRRARENLPKGTTRKVAPLYNISKSSVGTILGKRGYQYKKVSSRVQLTQGEKVARVRFCKEMIKWRGKKIYQTFFADEMGVWLSDALRRYGWARKGTRPELKGPREDVKLNVWGAISVNGGTSLDIYEDTLDAPLYKDILEDHEEEMMELYEDQFYYIHDNLKAHRAAEPWMAKQGFNIIKFPTYSPDLNIIENLWSSLKNRVTCDHPKTSSQLRNSLIRNWEI